MLGMFSLLICIFALAGILACAFAWIPLMLWGTVRWWRKKAHGKWMVALGGAWGLLAAFVIGSLVMKGYDRYARYATHQFNPGTYTGEIATLEIPYTGSGILYLYPADEDSRKWMVDIQATNRVVIPAGDYANAWLSVSVATEGRSRNSYLSCHFDMPFSVAPDGEFVFSGGFPLVASVEAKKRSGNRISLDFKLVDSAGNKVRADNQDKKIGFEALTPGGERFWADDFEWG